MPAPNIEANYELLQRVAEQFQSRSASIDEMINALLDKLQQLEQGFVGISADRFYDEMESDVLPRINRLKESFWEAGDTTSRIITTLKEAEERAANLFKGGNTVIAHPLGILNPDGTGFAGFSGGGGGGGGGGSWGDDTFETDKFRPNSLLDRDSPNTLYPSQMSILRDYLGGLITSEEAHHQMEVASNEFTWGNLIKPRGTLIDHQFLSYSDELYGIEASDGITDGSIRLGALDAEGNAKLGFTKDGLDGSIEGHVGLSALDVSLGNEYANLNGKILSGRLDGEGFAKIGTDGVDIGLKAEGALNIAEIHGSVEYDGFKATADASVGARAESELKATFDPKSGTLSAGGKVELFAGAEARGSIGYENDLFKVEAHGSVAAGTGVRGYFDIGIENGNLKISGDALGSFGGGVGAGVTVEVDLVETGEYIADQATQAAEDIATEIGSWFQF